MGRDESLQLLALGDNFHVELCTPPRFLHHHTEARWWHLAQLTSRVSTRALLGMPVAGGGPPSQLGLGAQEQEAFLTWKSVSLTHTWYSSKSQLYLIAWP